jgi:hypothetical protein
MKTEQNRIGLEPCAGRGCRVPFPVLIIIASLIVACAPVEATVVEGGRWERSFFTSARARDLVILDDVILFATTQGVFFSHDRKKFNRTGSDLPGSPEVIAIGAAEGVPDIYAVTEVGYLLRSSDRGRSFTTIGQFPHVRVSGMALTRAGRILVGSSSGLLLSNEDPGLLPGRQVRSYIMPWELLVLGLPIWRRAPLAGDTDLWKEWDVVKEGNVIRIAVDPDDADHIIIEILHEGAWRSTDEGVTWTPLRSDRGETVAGPVAFGPNGEIACGRFLSRDRGASWKAAALAPDPDDLKQAYDTAFPVHSSAFTPEGLWIVHYRAAAVYLLRPDGALRRAGDAQDFRARDRQTSPSLLGASVKGELWLATEGHGLYRRIRIINP